ncbi:porin family protein [Dysgonomonas sp. 521]|uniref:porin family protein n=1 Tax=Dysgonomonas sp. 521 TaxID=2302932 RepID=UPI002102A5E4|nr:porin family protein [Dysgonomonas sp. 521]
MQKDKERYKDQLDDFSKLLKQKLEDHRMSVDDDCWDAIEQGLKPAKKRRVMWWAVSSAAVAAVLALLLLLPFKGGEPDATANTDIVADSIPASAIRLEDKTLAEVAEPAKESKKEESKRKQYTTTKKSTGSVRLVSQQVSGAVSDNNGSSGTTKTVENSLLQIDTVQLADVGNSLVIADPDKESGLPVADSVPSQEQKGIKKNYEPTKILVAKKEKQDKWLLAASFSSGGSASLGAGAMKESNYLFSSFQPPAMNDAAEHLLASKEAETFAAYNDFTNVSHSMPLSFGITVRKDINDRIALETGLVYTYLSSKFNMDGSSYQNAKQELHYLGVPVNMVVYLWNNPRWNIYASAGAMAEKGLRLNYTQSVLQQGDDNLSKFSVKETVKGLQWSLNASVGVTYKFYDKWGLYFEPRYSYFFDNDQPFSIRTDNSHVFGLSAGLRFEF